MRALIKREARRGIWMEEAPTPAVGPNDVLIRVHKTSICGTDLHIYNWDAWAERTIPVPLVIGHEFVGTVAAVGEEVHGFRAGERVSGEGHITCGYCRNCRAGRRHLCRHARGVGVHRPGCFAEYLAIPRDNVYRVPDTIDDDVGAILDPLGNATHTALSFDLVGEDVLITGAGPIGIMATAIARKVGARFVVVTDVNDYRLELALRMGATRIVNVSRQQLEQVMQEVGMQEGFDVGLEMSGQPAALRDLLRTMNHGGRVALLGLFSGEAAIDWDNVIFKGLHLKGIYGREVFETWYKMIAMLESGLDVGGVITHRFPAARFEEAFAILASGSSGKVILDWSDV
jgi:threonine 3-dehydrogenase